MEAASRIGLQGTVVMHGACRRIQEEMVGLMTAEEVTEEGVDTMIGEVVTEEGVDTTTDEEAIEVIAEEVTGEVAVGTVTTAAVVVAAYMCRQDLTRNLKRPRTHGLLGKQRNPNLIPQ